MPLNLVLIHPRLEEWKPWVPLGLTYIASVLENGEHNVRIIDMNMEKIKYSKLLKVKNTDVIGITGMITQYQKVLELINAIRESSPDVPIILGGPLATALPKEMLENTDANFVVIGEGEKTTPNLVNAIENNLDVSGIDGIAYKKNAQVFLTKQVDIIKNLDAIPFPARHLLDMHKYIKYFENFLSFDENTKKILGTNMVTSRGCPFNCIYCFKGMWGYRWRGRSAENVVKEMEYLKDKYNVNGFYFVDDLFIFNKERVFEIAKLIKERNLDVSWYCDGRVDLVRKDLLKVMYDAGCKGIAYGIESGDQKMLNLMKKNITINQIRRAVKWTKESGIKVTGYFIIGMLDETKETINKTISFAKSLDLNYYGFSIATPLPGTELYRKAAERKLLTSKYSLNWHSNINANLTKDCTDNDLLFFKNKTFVEFTLKKRFGKYFYVSPIFWKKVMKHIQNIKETKAYKKFYGITKTFLTRKVISQTE